MKTKSTIADLYTSTDFGNLLTVVNEDQIDTNNLIFTTETPFGAVLYTISSSKWDITFDSHFSKLCAASIITVWFAPALHPLSTLLVRCFNELYTVDQATYLRFS